MTMSQHQLNDDIGASGEATTPSLGQLDLTFISCFKSTSVQRLPPE